MTARTMLLTIIGPAGSGKSHLLGVLRRAGYRVTDDDDRGGDTVRATVEAPASRDDESWGRR